DAAPPRGRGRPAAALPPGMGRAGAMDPARRLGAGAGPATAASAGAACCQPPGRRAPARALARAAPRTAPAVPGAGCPHLAAPALAGAVAGRGTGRLRRPGRGGTLPATPAGTGLQPALHTRGRPPLTTAWGTITFRRMSKPPSVAAPQDNLPV